jgi:hypothetical protein
LSSLFSGTILAGLKSLLTFLLEGAYYFLEYRFLFVLLGRKVNMNQEIQSTALDLFNKIKNKTATVSVVGL